MSLDADETRMLVTGGPGTSGAPFPSPVPLPQPLKEEMAAFVGSAGPSARRGSMLRDGPAAGEAVHLELALAASYPPGRSRACRTITTGHGA